MCFVPACILTKERCNGGLFAEKENMEHLAKDKHKNKIEHRKSGVAFCKMCSNCIMSAQNHIKNGRKKTLLAFATVF